MCPRISKRRYPERLCVNPICDNYFEPHDRRQIYCEPQCRINANNDRRHFENGTRFFDEKISRRNNKILEFLWGKIYHLKSRIIPKAMLDFEHFDFDSSYRESVNPVNGRRIRWYYNYGLEQFTFSKEVFILHKRSIRFS